ncbi:MAG: hypothetical protein IAE77_16100 [Prosthecobacter sp.]|jgi:hypothetical protein|uniref:hypothetical protein n=1 Tax=Prosthecobacter sp. TaxID=1965333 RepID=UPI0019F5947F|nr:hypothetical protein [Prosthecobacter sp.]MBE2284984.1 hypothetical protein [Prosthecobacter sp.]
MKTLKRTRIITALLLIGVGSSVFTAEPVDKGQRVFSAGHSFHMFMPKMLAELANAANISNHQQAGVSSIGGSYVYQHWNVADEKNALKTALRAGQVDVLTLSPIYLPDDGIENFAKLGFEHRPDIRVTIQEFWLPFDVFDVNYKKKKPEPVDRNSRTVAELRSINESYFKSMDDHVRALNQKFGKSVVFVVPVGQASLSLRAKIIAGEAPGLKQQNDLFTDAIGHATAPLQWLTAYCHFAVIYRRSPEGFPCPPALSQQKDGEALNRLLQKLAWDAVKAHPLSGVLTSAPRP